MSQPGWYADPDPQAPPGRLRWWDGGRWSDATHPPSPVPPPAGATTHDPRQPVAPNTWQPAAVRPGGAGGPDRRRRSPLSAVLAALLALTLLGGVLWWRHSRSGAAPEDQNPAAPTVSAWNESASPKPSPSSSGIRPSASGRPLRRVPCPRTAQPRASHPRDGRMHGGGLVVDWPKTFKPTPFTGMDFIGDRETAARALTLDRVSLLSMIVVGSLDRRKFGSLDHAAESVLTCAYPQAENNSVAAPEHVLVDEATTVQNHPAWHLRVHYPRSSRFWKDETIHDVEVVDLGGQYGLLWTSALTADRTATRVLGDSSATLTVGR